jgi:hypothetical protein
VLTILVRKLDGLRCDAIQKLLEGIHDLIEKLHNGQVGCCGHCVAILQGTMMWGLRATGLLAIAEVPDQRPFNGVSFGELLAGLRTIRTSYNISNLRNACCQIEGFLEPIYDEAEACIKIQPSDFGFRDRSFEKNSSGRRGHFCAIRADIEDGRHVHAGTR